MPTDHDDTLSRDELLSGLRTMRSLWRGAQDMNRNYRDHIATLRINADLHAHLLQMLGAKDHVDAGRIIGELHVAQRFVQDCRRPIPNWKVMLMVAAFLLGGFLALWSSL